jgi:oligopeptidase B
MRPVAVVLHSLLGLLLVAPAVPAQVAQEAPAPPRAERRVRVDTVHGDVRRDDYFWLRVKSDPAVRTYLEQENAYADAVLAPLAPLREQLYKEMLARIKQTDLSVPFPMGTHFYYSRTVEGQQYPIFARKAGSVQGPEQVMLDLNAMATGQTFMSLGNYEVSDNEQLLAYSFDSTGYRQYALRVKDLRTGAPLPTAAARVTSFAWAADNRTLFYTVEDSVSKRSYQLYRHTLGGGRDSLVYEEKDERFTVYVGRSRSEEYLFLYVGSLTSGEQYFVRANAPTAPWTLIAPRRDNVEYDADHHGSRFYIRVNDTGRNFRLVSAPVANPGTANWREVIPHRPAVMLNGFTLFANHMVRNEREGGLPHVVVTDLRSNATHRLAFPEPVYSAGLSSNARWNTATLRYAYQSFTTPSSVFDYDMNTRASTLLKETEVLGGYDRTQYTSERVWATARDGTRVPVSLVYRKGLKKDGSAAMHLYAYGSYGSSQNVGFNSNRFSLLDRGVVYALAHIRGGADMGKAWHDQGRMKSKMNTFTDFIDVAEFLLAQGYTSRNRLVIEGGSAGGLLMGAVTNMRPDLFKAVISNVPFVDVINTMMDETLPLTVGEFEEWGNPKKKDEYEYMKQYDPYMNLERKNYPAILVKTSFNDSQVMYHEPAKYTARMRELKTDANPLLLVTNMGAGHGGASGRYDRLREIAHSYAFLLWQAGVEPLPVP